MKKSKEKSIEMKGDMVDIEKAINVLTGFNPRGRHAEIRAYVMEKARRLRQGRSFIFSGKDQQVTKEESKSIYMSLFKEIRDRNLPFVIRSNPNSGVFAIFRADDFQKIAGKKKA